MSIDQLEAEVLKLNMDHRARLAESLLRSLDEPSEAELEQLWAEEAARRDAEMTANGDLGRPAEDVFRDIRKLLA